MLNLTAFDSERDRTKLQSSFDSIKNKDRLEIVMNTGEQNTTMLKIKFALAIPQAASFRFQNLFKLNLPNGHFYIAQCLTNHGFKTSSLSRELPVHKYNFQIVGIADISINLGKTLMRPETRTDKIVDRLFGNDIDLEDTNKFNDKYYLVSSTPETIKKHFDKGFVNTISKYDNLIMMARDKELCMTFQTEMEEEHSSIIEDIFSNCKFLMPN